MKEEELTALVNELNELIVQFRFNEALDRFYSDEIISMENEGQSTIGLTAYKEAGKRFSDNVSSYSATLKNVIISDNMSVCEWHYKFDHKEWGKWDRTQLSLQRWKNGKIIHERHHYTAAEQ